MEKNPHPTTKNKKKATGVIILLISLLVTVCLLLSKPSPPDTAQSSPTIYAAVLPHHLVAEDLVTDFLERLTDQTVSRVFLIGPNHFNAGDANLISDREIESLAIAQKEVVDNEHAITNLRPLVQSGLGYPDIIPIVVSSKTTEKEINSLSSYLSGQLGPDALIIASIDFSHQQTLDQANSYDDITWKLIQNKDYDSLRDLDNRYLDSPPSLIILQKALDKIGKNNPKLINHTNSATLLEMPYLEDTTSHMEIIFTD